MTNGAFKTLVGWFIVLTHIAVIATIFVLDMAAKLEETERNSALAATIPSAGTYLAAAVTFFMGHETSRRSAWSKRPASTHTVVVSLLLPSALFVASIVTLMASSRAELSEAKFGTYMMYIQTAQAVVCSWVYASLFKSELKAIKDKQS